MRRYEADERLGRQCPTPRFTGPAVVFRGWELVHAKAVSTCARVSRVVHRPHFTVVKVKRQATHIVGM